MSTAWCATPGARSTASRKPSPICRATRSASFPGETAPCANMTGGPGVDIGDSQPQDVLQGKSVYSAVPRGAHSLKPRTALCGLAMVAFLLPGCALLGGGTPKLDPYELLAPTPAGGARRAHTQVLIAEPSALKAVDGQNIVIK